MQSIEPTSRHLFRRYPNLIGKLPWMPLADLPTPVQKLEKLGAKIGAENLWMKRDDFDSHIYSGNKPRKFEFIFAEVLKQGKCAVLTIGSAGSNHGAATSLFCRHLNLLPMLALVPQPVLSYVRQNIKVNQCCGAEFMLSNNDVTNVIHVMKHMVSCRMKGKPTPYFMYFGGSSTIGNVGFVEAGLELAEQIEQGAMPKPDYIFVPTGSCGTHAGLLVGLKLAGLNIKVVGVRIVPKVVTNKPMVAFHANRVARYLRRLDSSFPEIKVGFHEINLLEDFYGGQYGRPTESGKHAIRILRETENLPLDPTYTAKAFAGMLAHIEQNHLQSKTCLYWQTLNSVDLTADEKEGKIEKLPEELQQYFSNPLFDPEL